jgi:hypothetical protein
MRSSGRIGRVAGCHGTATGRRRGADGAATQTAPVAGAGAEASSPGCVGDRGGAITRLVDVAGAGADDAAPAACGQGRAADRRRRVRAAVGGRVTRVAWSADGRW